MKKKVTKKKTTRKKISGDFVILSGGERLTKKLYLEGTIKGFGEHLNDLVKGIKMNEVIEQPPSFWVTKAAFNLLNETGVV